MKTPFSFLIGILFSTFMLQAQASTVGLLNVSYDPTREFYREYNQLFSEYWQETTQQSVNIQQSHGGSGAQARAVIAGLNADVVTLALAYDVDALREHRQLVDENWQARLPHNSAPYTSTIVLLVRKGNPKNIRDWDDLTGSDIKIITPNPKTSGGARWNYLALWGYALQKFDGSEDEAYNFVKNVFANVSVLDSGARASTNTFVQRGLGDVLIAWENEAYLVVEQMGKGKFEIVVPSVSILAEPPVSVVDKNVDRKGTRKVAEAYLNYLYSDAAQRLAAKHYYRPSNENILKEYPNVFAPVSLFTIDEVFGGWQKAQHIHFSAGGQLDHMLESLFKR